MSDVEAINLTARLVTLTDGTCGSVSNLFDAEGEETDDPSQAVSAVAEAGGVWFALTLADFVSAPSQ